jgi:hypothetical protein
MLTDGQVDAGSVRLTDGKLTNADQVDLLAIFRLWLGDRSHQYPGMASALANAVTPVADRLAGALVLLKAMGFSTTNLEGGRLGIKSSKREKRMLMVEYAFGLLFNLPSIDSHESCGSFGVSNQVTF